MKFLKSHFALSRSQQNGIFVLVLLIIIVQGILFSFDFYSDPNVSTDIDKKELEFYRNKLDSLKAAQSKTSRDTIYPFNPNYITDYKGYQLGMSIEEIDRLLKYRAEGKWINSAEDFKKVTGVSDSLLDVVKVNFRFPEWTQNTRHVIAKESYTQKPAVVIADLNSASSEDLQKVKGVGEVLSERIIKYRYKIGGYLDMIQLKDVYGLSPEVIENINRMFTIQSRPEKTRQDLNKMGVGQLSEIPYFDYELSRKIISYRKLHEGIRSFEELSGIDGFPSDKIDRIKLYLTLE